MQKEFPNTKVFETNQVELKNTIIFAGFVGASIVGASIVGASIVESVAINHIITELKMDEIAVMRSKYLPHQQFS